MISDEQWAAIEHLFPKNENRQGRKPVDGRGVVDGILWVLNQRERWQNLPQQYPAAQTCYNRWLEWRRSGIWQEIVDAIGVDACTSVDSVKQHGRFTDNHFGRSTGMIVGSYPVMVVAPC